MAGARRGRVGRDEDEVGQGGMPRQRWGGGSRRRSPDERRDSSPLEIVAGLTKFT